MDQPTFQIKKEENSSQYGRFVAEPLEQGYGHTLGVSLRRVLLTSIPGAAVTQVKVSGLRHQFGTIKGVKEDGVDIILNLKSLRATYDGDKPAKLSLSARGKGEIRASQIKVPADVKIANPDLLIATLADSKAKLDIDIQVEKGVGYSPSEERKISTVGVIPLDADFSPVKRVNYKVEETRVGRLTNYDKLTLEIWTDGSVSPEKALTTAAQILIPYFKQVVSPSNKKQQEAVFASHESNVSGISVEELNLPTRISNALVKAGYETVADLLAGNEEDVVRVRNLGTKSVKIIKTALREKDIAWGN